MDGTAKTRGPRTATFLLVAGAISAGVHGGLAPGHVREWLPLGVSFAVAAAAGAALVAALALRPDGIWPARLLGGLFASLMVAYALTRMAALPPLDPEREPLDTVGVCTGVVEAAGLLLALSLGQRRRPRLSLVTTGGTA
jgi:hypothetical protein